MYILDSGTEMTTELLGQLIDQHKAENFRYDNLMNMYTGTHDIVLMDRKERYKPDNRLVVNFAKYIVDTLNGFFVGIPIKVTHDIEQVNDYLNYLDKFNNQDDNNSELSKLTSIFGNAYELLFVDEDGDIGMTYIDPREAFVIYDNSIVGKPMYGVRFYENVDQELEGSYSDNDTIYYFKEIDGDIRIYDEVSHIFGDVPIIEYVENEEKIGAFESVATLINAYNKSISEKANDVDYFADAYLKILGASLDEDTLRTLRDSRIINMTGDGIDDKVIVEFMEKPNADITQENLLERLEKLIFQISMVMDITDDKFGTQSGIALKYKIHNMENLAKTKERKFSAGLNKRYKMIAHTGLTPIRGDEWAGIHYRFTRNYPANILEESEIAKNLTGITSNETVLHSLSIIDDAQEELKRIEAEYNQADMFGFGDVDEETN